MHFLNTVGCSDIFCILLLLYANKTNNDLPLKKTVLCYSFLLSSYRKLTANRTRQTDRQKEKASTFLTTIYAKPFIIPMNKTKPQDLNILDDDTDNTTDDDKDKDWEPPAKKPRTETLPEPKK